MHNTWSFHVTVKLGKVLCPKQSHTISITLDLSIGWVPRTSVPRESQVEFISPFLTWSHDHAAYCISPGRSESLRLALILMRRMSKLWTEYLAFEEPAIID